MSLAIRIGRCSTKHLVNHLTLLSNKMNPSGMVSSAGICEMMYDLMKDY
jgi:hypothetical protein